MPHAARVGIALAILMSGCPIDDSGLLDPRLDARVRDASGMDAAVTPEAGGMDSGRRDTGDCVPACERAPGRMSCGEDGCGGSCGSCAGGWVCDNEVGFCECMDSCGGKQCGANACGEPCGPMDGLCPAPQSCLADGRCGCSPACSEVACGSDGCGTPCSDCGFGFACNADQSACVAVCGGVGQPCCTSGTYRCGELFDPGLCRDGVCQPCGDDGQPCCETPSGSRVCDVLCDCNGSRVCRGFC